MTGREAILTAILDLEPLDQAWLFERLASEFSGYRPADDMAVLADEIRFDHRDGHCARCDGFGFIFVDPPFAPKCPECNGTGRAGNCDLRYELEARK